MQFITQSISLDDLKKMSETMFANLVKVVVDVQQKVMVVDAQMHSDEEEFLLENGSAQNDLWGINLYPDKFGQDGWIEFDSMINIRPSWGNKTRGVENKAVRDAIIKIVNTMVVP